MLLRLLAFFRALVWSLSQYFAASAGKRDDYLAPKNLLDHCAAGSGDIEADACSLLLDACKHNHWDVARALLEDPRMGPCIQNREGINPLCVAAGRGSLEVTKLLLVHPALHHPDAREILGLALVSAVLHRKYPIVQLLADDPRTNPNVTHMAVSPLYFACLIQDRASAKILVENPNVLLTAMDAHGSTPLFCACIQGNLELVAMLLATGKELDLDHRCGADQWTAQEAAAYKGHQEILELLEEVRTQPVQTRSRLCRQLGQFLARPFP